MQRTDSQIKQAVSDELKWDTRVDESEIGVAVKSGVVTLTGNITNWASKLAAQEAAHRVTGVLDVANDIQVKIPGIGARTDDDIARAVRTALEWNVFVPDRRIRSTVSAGWVTLEGDVDFGSERTDAAKAVEHLAGVRGVVNKIEIKAPKVAPTEVRKAIEHALERRAMREAAGIDLDVHDGRVNVSGVVKSWAERTAVVDAAFGTPGVRTVEDHLRIEPLAN